ncbi:MAG: PhoD-like phosphatase [Cyanophyceae cyanobacterium]
MLFSRSEFWQGLPLILAGPILRHTAPDTVTVWLALKKSCQVTLSVYLTQGDRLILRSLLTGVRSSVQVGQHLHLATITAQSVNGERLKPGSLYAYDLHFKAFTEPGYRGESAHPLPQALASHSPVTVSYFPHRLPTFALPPEDLNQLRLVHGSCRKLHGGGQDALPLLDPLIESSADAPGERPHQLFLTGDQIYGDDVADPLLWIASRLGSALLGWEEKLPVGDRYRSTQQLKPGERASVARNWAGLTAMLENKEEKAKSHLFSLGEYLAVYLLTWSPILWLPLPLGRTLYQDSKRAQHWDRAVETVEKFVRDLWQARRALANVPTYMICDDHDISDDWYLNQEWCHRVLGKPLGRQVVQNGLLAYALFQAWGNTPEQFSGDRPGAKLLRAVEQWSASAGDDRATWAAIGRYLGMPPLDGDGLPQLKQDGAVLVLDRHYEDGTQPLQWHYAVRSAKHEVLVLDTRTWRGYPTAELHTPPMLLCPTAFQHQLQEPLQVTSQLNEAGKTAIEVTFVVLPTNLVSLSAIDWVQEWNLRKGKVFGNDVGDSWNFHRPAFTQLLDILAQQRDRVLILSGDIHYGAVVRLNYWSRQAQNSAGASSDSLEQAQYQAALVVQLTASAIKNAEFKTYIAHTKLKSLLPEPTEYWVGWQEAPQFEIVAIPGRRQVRKTAAQGPTWLPLKPMRGNWECAWQIAVNDAQDLPDWQYQIEWIEREKAHPLFWGQRSVSSHSSMPRILRLFSWLWRNRWLQEGQEVVGRNNISVVTLQWAPEDDAKAVVQEIYWHPPWNPTRIVKSRYCASLQTKQPLL